MLSNKKKLNLRVGLTLIEVLIASILFVFLAMAIYSAFNSVNASVKLAKRYSGATAVASDQMEIIRALPYTDIESQTRSVTNSGLNFSVITTVQTIDDSYKLVTVRVDSVSLSTYIAP